MQSINLSDLFFHFVEEENGQRVVVFRSKSEGAILLKDGQSPEEVMADPQYQLQVIDSFISILRDAKSEILTGDRFGLQNEKAERRYKAREELDALKAELAALKAEQK